MATRAARASGAAPPKMPECSSRGERLDGHDDVDVAAQAQGDRGMADRGVAGVGDDDGVGAQEIGVLGDERLEPAGALLL